MRGFDNGVRLVLNQLDQLTAHVSCSVGLGDDIDMLNGSITRNSKPKVQKKMFNYNDFKIFYRV